MNFSASIKFHEFHKYGIRKHSGKGIPIRTRKLKSSLGFNNSKKLTGGYNGNINSFVCTLRSRTSAQKVDKGTDLLSKKL